MFTVRLSPAFAPAVDPQTGDEVFGVDVHPEIFLLRQTLSPSARFPSSVSLAGAGVIHDRDVAHFQFARDRLEFDVPLWRSNFSARFHVLVRDLFGFAFDCQTFLLW